MTQDVDDASFSLLRDAVERFVNGRLIPAEQAVAQSDEIGEDIVQAMRELGLFGLSIPPRWCGLGLAVSQEVDLVFALGRASPAFRSVVGTNIGIGSQPILIDGSEAQKDRYLPALS